VRDAAADLAKRTKLPADRLVMGGRSMGGRICSMVAAEDGAAGLVLLGYPLHPPGRADNLRIEHFPQLKMPVLFVSGTRDAFGSPDELKKNAKKIKGKVSWHWIETGDHGFKTLKSSGISADAALGGAAEAVVSFVTSL
jgi:predicted alpha/beta-hydrolase family hydrolase